MSLKRETDSEDSSASAAEEEDEDLDSSNNNNEQQQQTMNPLDSLKIVSMNLSECRPSAEAPLNWNKSTVAVAVREEILRSDPDIIALQECPTGSTGGNVHDWLEDTFGGDDYNYISIGTIRAHAGYVALLVKNSLARQTTRVQVPFMVPAVMAKLFYPPQRRLLMISSCHLAPFRDSAPERRQQVDNILRASAPLPLLVAGDTNMRVNEDHLMEAGLGLLDVWKLAGADPSTRFTWDTQDHRNISGTEGSFNRYYGDDTRQYHSRYDRIYIHPQGVLTPTVSSFALIANTPIAPSRTHFLSDHFGMAATVNLNWHHDETENNNNDDGGEDYSDDEEEEDEDEEDKAESSRSKEREEEDPPEKAKRQKT